MRYSPDSIPGVGGIFGKYMRSVPTQHREEFGYVSISSENLTLEIQQRQALDLLTTRHHYTVWMIFTYVCGHVELKLAVECQAVIIVCIRSMSLGAVVYTKPAREIMNQKNTPDQDEILFRYSIYKPSISNNFWTKKEIVS